MITLRNVYKNCNLCHHNCNVNRYVKKGMCGASNKLRIAKASLHYWEEPFLSQENGSGTIFFSYCSLKCIYCQNRKISALGVGKDITIKRFSDICLELQRKKANNINLVTPTHYVPSIIKGIKKAREKGLKIPVVYNTSSYENVETLKELEGTVDIYLPDMKYYNEEFGIKYSNVDNYFSIAKENIEEMYRQVGKPIFSKEGLLLKGVVVRVLLLPEQVEDAKKIIKYLYDTYKDNIYISIMNQYTPLCNFKKYPNLNRKVTEEEYDKLVNYAYDIGVRNAFIQEGETQDESFIPDFDLEGV